MIQLLLNKWTYIILGGLVLLVLSFHLGHKLGISKLTAYKLEVAQAETEQRNRIDAANEYAKQKEAERIAENTRIMNNLKRQIRELENEADKDPRANEPALSESSVVRINKVNVPKPSKTDSR